MKYSLLEEKQERGRLVRVYSSENLGTEVKTEHIYTDQEGNKYWGFVDLYKIPMIRTVMSKHLADLFGIGLSQKDIFSWCEQEKALLRSNDPEKYEKLYALILDKENVIKQVANPVKQHLALCTVYVLEDQERIDYFDEGVAEKKIQTWGKFPEMVAFFLNWQASHIKNYTKDLKKVFQTVSALQGIKGEQQQP